MITARTRRFFSTLKYVTLWFIAIFAFFSSAIASPAQNGSATPKAQPLPAAEAFQLSATLTDAKTLTLHWDLAPSYYLYRERFQIQAPQIQIGNIVFPSGRLKTNPLEDHPSEIYEKQLDLALPLFGTASNQSVTVEVRYQGCSEAGFCYPPIKKQISLTLQGPYPKSIIKTTTSVAADQPNPFSWQRFSSLLSDNNSFSLETFLFEGRWFWTLLAFYLLGVLIAFTPCCLPMIPIVSSIIVNQKSHENPSRLHLFLLSLTYVLGVATAYSLLGMIFAFIGSNLQATFQHPWVIVLVSIILIVMAFPMFGWYEVHLPHAWQQKIHHFSNKHQSSSWLGIFIMGTLSILLLSPCVTPPLVAALSYISHSGNIGLGMLALFCMGLGIGLPLLIVGVAGPRLLPKSGPWMEAIKWLLGLILLIAAFFNLSRLVPSASQPWIWGTLCILLGLVIIRKPLAQLFSHSMSKALRLNIGIPLLLFGSVLIVINVWVPLGLGLLLAGIILADTSSTFWHWIQHGFKSVVGLAILLLSLVFFFKGAWFWGIAWFGIGLTVLSITATPLRSISHTIKLTLGCALLLLGILLMLDMETPTQHVLPLYHQLLQQSPSTQNDHANSQLKFIPIKTAADLQKQLQLAAGQNEIVLVDFYADWCVSCHDWDHLLNAPQVQQALNGVRLLRADVTKNDDTDQALEQQLEVIAPPTLVFFKQEKELSDLRIIGKIPQEDFLQLIGQAQASVR